VLSCGPLLQVWGPRTAADKTRHDRGEGEERRENNRTTENRYQRPGVTKRPALIHQHITVSSTLLRAFYTIEPLDMRLEKYFNNDKILHHLLAIR